MTAVPLDAVEDRAPSLRKRELIDKIVKRSGVKKKAAKPVVEALLAELGETLAAGRELVLPPLGRIKINREKSLANGRVIILKVRQKDAPAIPAPEVAEAE
jgi:DNA-binding protein HU-alpha